ncbi:carbohydrate ABC transporter permease [Paenibacillus sepulcri]|uniref:Carbohydrate ABC transporter permease n=1 Tax=Paenibacillus sepulcri TaxID=359917 RepID=A0ABS7C2C0_9BACL|nr:carbohydrate ABC transporter permease [Paenibacillus sepulcri]
MSGIKIKESPSDRIFLGLIYAVLILILIIVAYPLLNVLSSSFSDSNAVVAGRVSIFPVEPTLAAYKAIFASSQLLTGYLNSIFYTIAGFLFQVSLTVMVAYPLARKQLYGRGLITGLLVFTMFFGGGLIPTYLVVKSLGILDTRWALILPGALAVFQVIVARTFFQTSVPDELYEAAELDGCSEIGIFWRIVLPLAKPILAVLVLIYGVNNWNAYFDAMIYLNSDHLFPLQLILRNILILNTQPGKIMADPERMMALQEIAALLKYALIVVASLPVLIFYPFIQKYFVKGMMIGSLKG